MFNEQNAVENFVRDLLCGVQPLVGRVVETSRTCASARRNERSLGLLIIQ